MRWTQLLTWTAIGFATAGCGDEIPQGTWRLLDDGTEVEGFRFLSFCGELRIEGADASLIATVPAEFDPAVVARFWDIELAGTASAADGSVEVEWRCVSATPSPKSPVAPDEEDAAEVCQFFEGWWIRCIIEDDGGLTCPADYLVGETGDATCEDWTVMP